VIEIGIDALAGEICGGVKVFLLSDIALYAAPQFFARALSCLELWIFRGSHQSIAGDFGLDEKL
jgi:hypothetical protein